MRICVFHADVDKVMCPELWPDGVSVRPWTMIMPTHLAGNPSANIGGIELT